MLTLAHKVWKKCNAHFSKVCGKAEIKSNLSTDYMNEKMVSICGENQKWTQMFKRWLNKQHVQFFLSFIKLIAFMWHKHQT